MLNKNFFELVDLLEKNTPFSPTSLERFLPSKFSKNSKGNDFVSMYSGTIFHLKNGLTVDSLDLRVSKENFNQTFLAISISGNCVTRQSVESHFHDLQLTDIPRGRSPDEVVSYSINRSWGKLSFSYKQSNSDCLADVIFDTFNH